MALDARIRELGSRHQSLELRELKRQKLRLKEEIETLRGRLH